MEVAAEVRKRPPLNLALEGTTLNHVFRHLHVPTELAIEFIAVFSRMEHALKSTLYATGNIQRVEPNWDRFANDIDAEFKAIDNPSLTEAVKFILSEPPRKQILGDDGVQFVDQTIDCNQRTTQQALLMVRTVRNNLFHGGKYLPDGEIDEGRNKRLVEASLLILNACCKLHQEVRNSYER